MSHRAKIHRHVSPLLRLRVRAYFVIASLLFGICIADAVRYPRILPWLLLAVGVGSLGGFFFSRMHHVYWDSVQEKVVAKLDIYGAVLLALYAAVEVHRDEIIAHFARGHAATLMLYAALCGIFIGRGVGMSRRAVAMLRSMKGVSF